MIGQRGSAAMVDSPGNSSPVANMLQSHLPEVDHGLGEILYGMD
jgi:hypothetical protein